MRNVVSRAAAVCGGIVALSQKLKVSYQQVQQWRANGGFPTRRLIQIESKTGIPRHELAPELFEGYQRVAPLPVPAEEEKK